ncbi:MAG: hypothetical protein KatS3mg068_1434 [Candidatus Sericytochromatia bacterium]|nr:MAG: hypothetical protein KatS3mg068_1434 [Candidatus Sericytochromatia bacterium]
MQEELKINFETLLSFTKALIKLAQIDNVIPEEKEYIKNFFEEVSKELNVNVDFEKTFKDLENQNINDEDIKNLSSSEEIKEYFLKTCIFLACVDYFSQNEKTFIKNIAEKLNFNNLDKLVKDVQNELLKNFENVTIFKDSLDKVKSSISI